MSEHADAIRKKLEPWELAALNALEAELAEVKRRASELCVQFVLTEERCEAAEAENARLKKERDKARDLARNLFNMIDRETWRATGGDDGQGHYEGDGYAESVAVEIQSWQRGVALASDSDNWRESDAIKQARQWLRSGDPATPRPVYTESQWAQLLTVVLAERDYLGEWVQRYLDVSGSEEDTA